MIFVQRRINVAETSWRCIDVKTTLYKSHRFILWTVNALTRQHKCAGVFSCLLVHGKEIDCYISLSFCFRRPWGMCTIWGMICYLPINLIDYYRLFDITWKDASLVAYFKWKYKMFLVLTVHILLDSSFVFSVSVLCSQIFTLELNSLAKICLTHALSIIKCFSFKNIYYFFLLRGFFIDNLAWQYFELFRNFEQSITCSKPALNFTHILLIHIQSTLVISKSKGLRNTSWYPYFDISELWNWGKQLIEQPLLTEWTCNFTPKSQIYWKYYGKEDKLLLRAISPLFCHNSLLPVSRSLC